MRTLQCVAFGGVSFAVFASTFSFTFCDNGFLLRATINPLNCFVAGGTPIEAIIAAREAGGPFLSFYDFCLRVDRKAVNKRALEALVKAGREVGFKVPVVVRLEGTNVVKAREILSAARTAPSLEVLRAQRERAFSGLDVETSVLTIIGTVVISMRHVLEERNGPRMEAMRPEQIEIVVGLSSESVTHHHHPVFEGAASQWALPVRVSLGRCRRSSQVRAPEAAPPSSCRKRGRCL